MKINNSKENKNATLLLVCIEEAWQATWCAEEVAGKIMSIWFPILAFIMIEFDHVVADQFLIPVGMMYSADVSISQLMHLQGTLAACEDWKHAWGGGLLVGAAYWYVYHSMASTQHIFKRSRRSLLKKRQASRRSDNAENTQDDDEEIHHYCYDED